VTTLGPRELADRTGVSTDTLRHYERKGLLARPHRTAAGYRRYSPETVARVLLIQRALVIGFSLADLARVLKERDRGEAPCRSVHKLVSERIQALDRQLEDLAALRADLAGLLKDWDGRLAGAAPGARAHLLETLGAKPAIERARQRRRQEKLAI
jgi:DNA-binding transcriptional MerR regulator